MLNILNLTKTNKLILATFAFLAVLAFGGGSAHAATLNVAGGCTLPIAIDSVNAGSNQTGCTATGGYGTNDTITIPAGTQTLTADLPQLTESASIVGSGTGITIVNGGAGQYHGFQVCGNISVNIQDLTVTAFKRYAIDSCVDDLTLTRIDVDGQNVTAESGLVFSVYVRDSGSDNTVSVSNVRIHDIDISADVVNLLYIDQESGNTTAADINNVTVDHITNHQADSVITGFLIGTGGDFSGGGGTMNATATNVTVDSLISDVGNANAFGGAAFVLGSVDATSNVIIRNATVTGLRGGLGPLGNGSAAFFSAGASTGGATSLSKVEVSNSLFANNQSQGVANNCTSGDFSSALGGSGPATGTIISNGYNISDDATCTTFTQLGDQQNINNIISTLGPLQNNGGLVPTRALLPGSPAINTGGSVLGVTTDARGVTRPKTCPSVGAFQFEGAVCGASTPSASGGTNAGAPNTGVGSVTQIPNVLASMLGIGLLTYVFRKQQRTS
jgi:hypothetical protein